MRSLCIDASQLYMLPMRFFDISAILHCCIQTQSVPCYAMLCYAMLQCAVLHLYCSNINHAHATHVCHIAVLFHGASIQECPASVQQRLSSHEGHPQPAFTPTPFPSGPPHHRLLPGLLIPVCLSACISTGCACQACTQIHAAAVKATVELACNCTPSPSGSSYQRLLPGLLFVGMYLQNVHGKHPDRWS